MCFDWLGRRSDPGGLALWFHFGSVLHPVPSILRRGMERRIRRPQKFFSLVDADPDLRRGLNLRLRDNHFEAAYATDGFSAIAMAQKEPPDLIILDIGLPAGDGFIGFDRLQQSAQLSSISVIVLAARDPQYNRERTLKAGACAFLQKPADNNELMDVIRTTLSPVWPGTAASALPSN
jgi:DNA-binding response OmpR family regulator